ncbi:MAG TPA: cytochrome c maturation protein CcmE [Gammaproteobacteria bacterium]|nr:cytochrome c maturation protein CcmE [Gammaproteobacteria bacterium]
MRAKRKRRLILSGLLLVGIGTAVTLTLLALNKNINLFYTPTQVEAGEAPVNQSIRVGGLVEKGSVSRDKKGLTVRFKVTDTARTVAIEYTGILPDLFREGQGIVAQGRLNERGVFIADTVLAKHDENYMPPEVADALQTAKAMRVTK